MPDQDTDGVLRRECCASALSARGYRLSRFPDRGKQSKAPATSRLLFSAKAGQEGMRFRSIMCRMCWVAPALTGMIRVAILVAINVLFH